MRTKLLASVLAMPLLGVLFAATAQTPDPTIGKWKTFDDETGKAMSITEVYRTKSGSIAAKVVETLNKPNALCEKCDGKDKGKPIIGMMVFWDMKQEDGVWGGGRGFKPSTGDSFKVKSVKVTNGGKTLEVTGCKLMFCRTGKWERIQ
jgi:hypothetical protein